jgi:hypothetical protein
MTKRQIITMVGLWVLLIGIAVLWVASWGENRVAIFYRGRLFDWQFSSTRSAVGFMVIPGLKGAGSTGFRSPRQNFYDIGSTTPRSFGFQLFGFALCHLGSGHKLGPHQAMESYTFISAPHWFLIGLLGFLLWRRVRRSAYSPPRAHGFEIQSAAGEQRRAQQNGAGN